MCSKIWQAYMTGSGLMHELRTAGCSALAQHMCIRDHCKQDKLPVTSCQSVELSATSENYRAAVSFGKPLGSSPYVLALHSAKPVS